MKQITFKVSVFLAFIYVFAMVFSSCSISESVVNNGFLQKRKYNKGFHKAGKTKIKSTNTQQEEILVLNNSKIKDEEISSKIENVIGNKENFHVSASNSIQTEVKTESNIAKVSSTDNKEHDSENKLVNKVENKIKKVSNGLKNNRIIDNSSNTSSSKANDMMILLIILAFLIPFVAVGLYTDWDVTKTLIALLLMLLFWLPGIIYALLTIFDKI